MKNIKGFLSKANYGEKSLWLNIFNVLLILYCVKQILDIVLNIYHSTIIDLNNWGLTEWLINYQGGFVRRGLIGEMVFQLSCVFNVYPNVIVFVLALLSFCVAVFFIAKIIIKKEWCWWMLPMVFFLNDVTPARKDYLIFSAILLLFYLYTVIKKPIWKFIILNIVVIVASNIHEVFFVFVFPFCFLLVLSDSEIQLSKIVKLLFFIPSIVMFVILGMNIGDNAMAQSIHNSLISIMPIGFPSEPFCSIDAIGWDPAHFREGCIRDNFMSSDYGIPVLAVRPLLILLIAYFTSNIIRVFNNSISEEEHQAQRTIVYFNMFIAIVMLCTSFDDFTRLIEFWTITSLVIYTVIPSRKILAAFPAFFVGIVNKWDGIVCKFLRPNKVLFVLLILFMGGSSCGLNFMQAFEHSIIGPFIIKSFDLLTNIL